jgi:hypothetical protein
MVYLISHMERGEGMSRITLALILSVLLIHTAQSANLRMCTDKDGHKTFTQGACPKNTAKAIIEVQPAQSPVTAIRANERQMLNQAKSKKTIKRKTQQKKPKKTKAQEEKPKKKVIRRSCGK